MIICEGPFDAISIDGVAVLSNELSPQQRLLIEQKNIQPVVVPDKDNAGKKLIKQVLDYENWWVSYPDWPDDIKDINDSVKKYGRLYTLYNIITNIQKSKLKIELGMKTWFKETK